MPLGIIKSYHADRGYGFIAPTDGSKQLFFHFSQLTDQVEVIEGERVGYTVEVGRAKNSNGRNMATKIHYV